MANVLYWRIKINMSLRSKIVLLVVGLMVLHGCAAQRSNSGKAHSEDLSVYRPRFVNEPTAIDSSSSSPVKKVSVANPFLNVNRQVDAVLDSIDKIRLLKKVIDGYTIQIYSGTNREDALNTKRRMTELSDLISLLQYNQPKFRVTAGAYYTRLDAQKDLVRVKHLFPNSILIPQRVFIK
jgi:SPOR domain